MALLLPNFVVFFMNHRIITLSHFDLIYLYKTHLGIAGLTRMSFNDHIMYIAFQWNSFASRHQMNLDVCQICTNSWVVSINNRFDNWYTKSSLRSR